MALITYLGQTARDDGLGFKLRSRFEMCLSACSLSIPVYQVVADSANAKRLLSTGPEDVCRDMLRPV